MMKVTFGTKDGLQLCGVWNIPKIKTEKAVVLAHGITADKDEDGIFVDLAKRLCLEGFAVLRFDFRGHGESNGKPEEMTLEGELGDLQAAFEEIEKKAYKNIGLLGASFGGAVAVLYTSLSQRNVKCLCLWNPCLNYDHCFLNPTLPWIKDRKAHMKKDLLEKGWTELGSGKYKLGKPLFEEMEKSFPFEEMKKISIPTIIIHGDKDTYVPYDDSVFYVSNLIGPKKLITIKSAQHGFQDDPHTWRQSIDHTLAFFKKYL